MVPPPPKDRSRKVRAPHNVGRVSLPCEQEVKRGWTSHWGDGRYFQKWGEKIDPNLHGTPSSVLSTDKASEIDVAGKPKLRHRSSAPLKSEAAPTPRGWQQHWGVGRNFECPMDQVDCHIRGEEGTSVIDPLDRRNHLRGSYQPNAKNLKRSVSEYYLMRTNDRSFSPEPTHKEFKEIGWRRHLGRFEDGNFTNRFREIGLQDCDTTKATLDPHTDY